MRNMNRAVVAATCAAGVLVTGWAAFDMSAGTSLLRGPLLGLPAAILAVTLAGRATGYRSLFSAAVLAGIFAAFFVGRAWGRAHLYAEIRREIPALRVFIRGLTRSPDVRDVTGSRLFVRAYVRTETQPVERSVVRFPLADRTAVEFDPALTTPADTRCDWPIEPHWSRRIPCD
jgi:hypothetical protein